MSSTSHEDAILEEQTLPRYSQRTYLPVRIGDVYGTRYRVAAKLGYGAYSTVWLARDERSQQYATLKVCIENDSTDSPVSNEINMLKHLQDFARSVVHPGTDFVRMASDVFEIETKTGKHTCIVSKPHGCSLRKVQEYIAPGALLKSIIKPNLHRLILALNFLHATCDVIHTDLSPQNVLMQAEHEDIFKDIEAAEISNRSPSVQKVERNVIFQSQQPLVGISTYPVLTDFGQMRRAGPNNTDCIMADIYRAPEVLLKLPWSHPVDLWSLGVMTLELLEGKNLFKPIDHVHRQYVLPLALAQYIGYLGPPPLRILRDSPVMAEYFDSQGNWNSEPPIPSTSLEEFVTTITPGEEKDLFLRFVRRLLTWDPHDRATANEIFTDPWLMKTFD
ncbi:unnamed protein product [Cercospora beticola]|nr:unnamed protein product [Cercospora beticola]